MCNNAARVLLISLTPGFGKSATCSYLFHFSSFLHFIFIVESMKLNMKHFGSMSLFLLVMGSVRIMALQFMRRMLLQNQNISGYQKHLRK